MKMKLLLVALLPALALGQLVTGGISDTTVSPTDETVVFAIKAINDHLAASGDGPAHTLGLVDIVRSRTQVVAGWKLYLTLHMTEGYYCDVTVWFRDWLQGDERLQVTDGPTCRKHLAVPRAGAVSEARPLPVQSAVSGTEESVVHKALDYAICAYNAMVNDAFASKLGDTAGVTFTQQLTAGMTYRFYNVPLVRTTCHLDTCDNLDINACDAQDRGQTQTCDLQVQYQAWMTPAFTLSNISC